MFGAKPCRKYVKNKISLAGSRKWLFAGYIHVVLGNKSLKRNNEKLFPFFCCLLMNNKKIIKGTFFRKNMSYLNRIQQVVFDQLRRYLCRRHNTFLTQISSNNFNGTGQITFNCLFQKPNIKAIVQISNLTEEKILYKSVGYVSLKWSIFCSCLKRLNNVWAQV